MTLVRYEGETWMVVDFITEDIIVVRKLFDTSCKTDTTLFAGQFEPI